MVVTQTIPKEVAERYFNALKGLVSTVRSGLGVSRDVPQSLGCQQKVLPLLEDRLAAAQAALAHYTIGDQDPLIELALKSRFLARETDGYSLGFAGQTLAAQYEDRRRHVVFAAWQVCDAAGVV